MLPVDGVAFVVFSQTVRSSYLEKVPVNDRPEQRLFVPRVYLSSPSCSSVYFSDCWRLSVGGGKKKKKKLTQSIGGGVATCLSLYAEIVLVAEHRCCSVTNCFAHRTSVTATQAQVTSFIPEK